MAKNEEKKFWVWGQIEEEQHTALLELSTATGKHPRQLVELGVELVIATLATERTKKGLFVPPTVRLEAMATEDRAQQLRLNQAKVMAYNHVQNPTDESAERLAEACDIVGISVEAILEQVSSNPIASEIMGDGKSLTSVESFLIDYLKPGKLYSSSEVIAAAEARGFKAYLVKEAKRKLKIVSKRDKSEWMWHFPATKKAAEEDDEERVF